MSSAVMSFGKRCLRTSSSLPRQLLRARPPMANATCSIFGGIHRCCHCDAAFWTCESSGRGLVGHALLCRDPFATDCRPFRIGRRTLVPRTKRVASSARVSTAHRPSRPRRYGGAKIAKHRAGTACASGLNPPPRADPADQRAVRTLRRYHMSTAALPPAHVSQARHLLR